MNKINLPACWFDSKGCEWLWLIDWKVIKISTLIIYNSQGTFKMKRKGGGVGFLLVEY